MLDSIMPNRKWNWVAVGKHPVAKDYIHFGGHSALLDAVAEWLAKGYRKLTGGRKRSSVHHSWRFWLKGIKKGTLVCGLGLDSSDSLGRPYPLLIMGEGNLKGWERQWSLLSTSLGPVWSRMEYIASHRFENAMAMQEEIKRLYIPDSNNHALVEVSEDGASATSVMDLGQCEAQLRLDGFALVGLNPCEDMTPDQMLMHFQYRLKACCPEVPKGVFIGGTPRESYLAVAQHPLGAQDFLKLWTI